MLLQRQQHIHLIQEKREKHVLKEKLRDAKIQIELLKVSIDKT